MKNIVFETSVLTLERETEYGIFREVDRRQCWLISLISVAEGPNGQMYFFKNMKGYSLVYFKCANKNPATRFAPAR